MTGLANILVEAPWSTLLVCAGGVLLLTGLAAGVGTGRRHGARFGIALAALRVCSLLLLGLLLHEVFWGGRRSTPVTPDDETEGLSIAVLQDASQSMQFTVTRSQSRAELATAVVKALRNRTEEWSGPPLSLSRFLFAHNLVAWSDREHLRPASTRLADAVGQLIGRAAMDALVIVSDGASTDGSVPVTVIRWAQNRHLPVYAICADSPRQNAYDVAVAAVECEKMNPKTVGATVTCSGPVPAGGQKLRFMVDGAVQGSRSVPVSPTQTVHFPVVGLAGGWHEFAIQLPERGEEITALNNLRRGVFRIAAERILLIHDVPRVENLYLTRFLRAEFGESLVLASVADPGLAQVHLSDFLFVVLADVRKDRVPAALLNQLRLGDTPFLVLAGPHVKDWTIAVVPQLPVVEHTGVTNFGGSADAEESVRIRPEGTLFDLPDAAWRKLQLNLVHTVTQTMHADVALHVEIGDLRMPLCLVDRRDAPSCAVLLADTTWKWAVSPELATRRAYEAFWLGMFTWLGSERTAGAELRVEFRPDARDPDVVVVTLRSAGAVPADQLRDVTVTFTHDGDARTVVPVREGTAFETRYVHSGERPAVVWVTASARHGPTPLSCERTPLLVDVDSVELLQTASRPDTLLPLTGARQDRFGYAADADRVIDAILADLKGRKPLRQVRQRRAELEMLLAALLFLFLGTEWALERHLHGRA